MVITHSRRTAPGRISVIFLLPILAQADTGLYVVASIRSSLSMRISAASSRTPTHPLLLWVDAGFQRFSREFARELVMIDHDFAID